MKNWIWLLIGSGAGLVLFSGRKQIMQLTGRVIQKAQEQAFSIAIPTQARPYAARYLQVARETGLDPFLLVAIAMRESLSGSALKPPGPAGTGDFTARNWGPYPLPPDGKGWGRGIMQIDYYHHRPWLDANNWGDPLVNIRKGAAILKGKMVFFQGKSPVAGLTDGKNVTISTSAASKRGVKAGSYVDPRPLTGDLLVQATIASYNGGEGEILKSVAVGVHPDTTTAGGPYGKHDYSRDVLSRVSSMVANFLRNAPKVV